MIVLPTDVLAIFNARALFLSPPPPPGNSRRPTTTTIPIDGGGDVLALSVLLRLLVSDSALSCALLAARRISDGERERERHPSLDSIIARPNAKHINSARGRHTRTISRERTMATEQTLSITSYALWKNLSAT